MNEQFDLKKLSFPARYNIHLIIEGPLLALIQRLNNEIQNLYSSYVVFNKSSDQMPHTTLLMGEVANASDFKTIDKMLEKFAKTISVFDFKLTKPKMVSPDNRYIFIYPTSSDMIIQIKEKLSKQIGNLIKDDLFGSASIKPHITIACLKKRIKPVKFNETNSNKAYKILKIGISETGKKGTCVSLLKTYALV